MECRQATIRSDAGGIERKFAQDARRNSDDRSLARFHNSSRTLDDPIVANAVFLPDDKMIATRSRKAIKFWRTEGWKEVEIPFEGMASLQGINLKSCDFSPDSRLMAATNGSEVSVWELNSGKLVLQFVPQYHNEVMPLAVVFLPNGRLLAIGKENPLVGWDIMAGNVAFHVYPR